VQDKAAQSAAALVLVVEVVAALVALAALAQQQASMVEAQMAEVLVVTVQQHTLTMLEAVAVLVEGQIVQSLPD